MRKPRAGLPWSKRRVAIRSAYADYMDSPAWFARRERWLEEWKQIHAGQTPLCLACGKRWTLHCGDLHHRTYERLGHEHYRDLAPMCRDCHLSLHALIESTPQWRRLAPAQATDMIVNWLAHQHLEEGDGE
jgi:hypothetical protein